MRRQIQKGRRSGRDDARGLYCENFERDRFKGKKLKAYSKLLLTQAGVYDRLIKSKQKLPASHHPALRQAWFPNKAFCYGARVVCCPRIFYFGGAYLSTKF